jgi:N-acetylglucosaminyldiphosphoundecaprenol N-acetyl-beta-D-mannosaminyltransferase
MKEHVILGVRIHDLSDEELDDELRAALDKETPTTIVTPNPEMLLIAQKKNAFKALLNRASLILADGIGVHYAAAALENEDLHNRHTGVDTLDKIIDLAQEEEKRIVFVGGKTGVAERAALMMKQKYPNLHIRGIDPGIVVQNNDGVVCQKQVLIDIREQQPDILVVALGQEKQEYFMDTYVPKLPSVRIVIGVGGAFDVLAGQLRRAPRVMRKMGLEWLWRLRLEPRRFPRIVRAAIVFPGVVALESVKRKRFMKALKRVGKRVTKELFSSKA